MKCEKACGVLRKASDLTKPEFELYLTYFPSIKCSKWKSGELGLSKSSKTHIWKISTLKENFFMIITNHNRKTYALQVAQLKCLPKFIVSFSGDLLGIYTLIFISEYLNNQ